MRHSYYVKLQLIIFGNKDNNVGKYGQQNLVLKIYTLQDI